MRRPQLRRGWTTVRLFSGLGNQLFQYATGRAVAERTHTKLRFDLSYFGLEPHRSYALGDFHIRATLDLSEPKSAEFMADHAAEAAWAREHHGAVVVREQTQDFDPQLVPGAPKNGLLCGYWQSEGYFKDQRELIRRELRPRRTPTIEQGRQRIVAAGRSVAVHVRRGDIASDPDMHRLFGLVGAEHYARAAALVRERHADAEFFVFSDDPEWCEEHLELPGGQTMVSGQNAPFEDLALMACCDDAIIGNSTFAWWGAWLGERPDSLVVVPQEIFPGEREEPAGLIPERWIRV